MNSLASFFRNKGVSFVWVSAVFAPILLVMGVAENKMIHLVIAVLLLLLVLLSIIDGFKALKSQLMANFIASAFVPLVSIVVGAVFAVFKFTN